jgi:hypothetical protein
MWDRRFRLSTREISVNKDCSEGAAMWDRRFRLSTPGDLSE